MSVTATIQELLQGIMDSQYGRDMRQYIHDAIQKCYEEGSAGETDLTARNGVLKILEMFGNVETGTTASRAYSIGDIVVYDGRLYKALAAISQGDTFTVDTNIEEISANGATMSPPDFELTETLWHEEPNDSFTRTINVAKNGWYSLYAMKHTTSSLTVLDAFISVDINGTYQQLAYISCSGNSLGAMTPWVYLKAGQTIAVGGTAQDAFFYYAPCL